MRNFKVLTVTMVILLLISSTAFAGAIGQEDKTDLSVENSEISIGYDSPLYKAKLFWEKIRLAVKFTDAGKANLESRLALRRMAEADLLIEAQRHELAQGIMNESVVYISKATDHAADALLKKDTKRTRRALDGVSKSQYAVLKHISALAEKYPDTFDTQQMTLEIKDSMTDIIVVQAFLSYKENLFENQNIRNSAIAALNEALIEGGLDAEDIALHAIETIEESGTELTQEEIDAITSATYDILQETGGTDGAGTDATTSASLTAEPGAQLQAEEADVDATTSATITENNPSIPSDGSPVDAVTSATPAGAGGTSTGSGASYDDDDYEDDDNYEKHEEYDDDDDEHEEDDD
jgi:hypothetical protein